MSDELPPTSKSTIRLDFRFPDKVRNVLHEIEDSYSLDRQDDTLQTITIDDMPKLASQRVLVRSRCQEIPNNPGQISFALGKPVFKTHRIYIVFPNVEPAPIAEP